jgi:hypothetical protein
VQYRCIALCIVLGTGCGQVDATRHLDAAAGPKDASIDAPPDAPPDAACQKTLLTGGSDVTTQGWTFTQQPPATVTNGADYVQLQTSTTAGQNVGGQLLVQYANAFTPGAPFKLEVVMLVQAVNSHNQFDSGAALLGGFTAPFGTTQERGQMIYFDAAGLGWADDSQTHAATITDGAYHTYVLSVDTAQMATLTMDGNPMLTRGGFTSNGTIAIGDQTNDANVDSTLRIKSVRLLCP